jgi:hypothetical protein
VADDAKDKAKRPRAVLANDGPTEVRRVRFVVRGDSRRLSTTCC